MPQVAVFFGIIIRMYFGDHNPPHFHAEYQGERATFDFEGNLLLGEISSRTARRLIKTWATQRQRELKSNWHNAQRGLPLLRIAPLE